jgi:hypothetical protein
MDKTVLDILKSTEEQGVLPGIDRNSIVLFPVWWEFKY